MGNVEAQRGGPGAGALEGTVLAGRYRLARILSSGANTVIMDAIDVQNDSPVTVKVVRPEHAQDPEFRRKFRRLAEISNAVTHPNIASVTDWGEVVLRGDSTVFWTVDALGGGSLRDILDRGRLLEPGQALVLGLEACRALDAAHHKGLFHTELTPSKMVFGVDRRLRVVDFGMARLLAEPAWADAATVPTHVARYASPEQALGLPIDAKTDVYALALVMIEAVTGSVPFAADSTVSTLAGRVDRLMPVSADLGALASVLERAGRPESADRFTAAEFGRALVQTAPRLTKPEPIPILASGTFDTQAMRRPTDPTGGVERPAPVSGLAGVDETGVTPPPSPEASSTTAEEKSARGAAVLGASAAGAAVAVAAGAAVAGAGPAAGPHGAVGDAMGGATGGHDGSPPEDDLPGGADGQPESAADGDSVGGDEPDSAANSEPDVTSDSRVVADPDVEATPDAESDVESAPHAEPAPDAVEESDVEPESEIESEIEPESEIESDSESEIESDPEGADDAVTVATAIIATDLDDPSDADPSDVDPSDADASVTDPSRADASTEEMGSEQSGDPEPEDDPAVGPVAEVEADEAVVEPSPAVEPTPEVEDSSSDSLAELHADLDASAASTAVMPTTGIGTDAGDSRGGGELFDDAPSGRRKGPIIAMVLVLLVGLGALGYAGSLLLQTKSFTVPVLAGVSETQALDQIDGNGWDLETLRERSDSFPEPDTVIRSVPGAGVELDEGQPFTLVLSDGPEFRTLPELNDVPFNAAVTELADLGLIGVESDDREFSETVPIEAVISWSVEGDVAGDMQAGAQILPGETIVMTLSKGPEPRLIPDLTTGTGPEGRAVIEGMQLEYVRDPDVFSDDVPAGQVVSQTPAAGESLDRGGTVTVQVSKGPDVVEFPALDGLGYTEAEQLLIDTGFTIGNLLGTTQGTFVEATIDDVDVPVGEVLPRGTSVDLIFL